MLIYSFQGFKPKDKYTIILWIKDNATPILLFGSEQEAEREGHYVGTLVDADVVFDRKLGFHVFEVGCCPVQAKLVAKVEKQTPDADAQPSDNVQAEGVVVVRVVARGVG